MQSLFYIVNANTASFLMFLMEEPEAARELLEYCYELELRFALAQVAEGAEILGIGTSALVAGMDDPF